MKKPSNVIENNRPAQAAHLSKGCAAAQQGQRDAALDYVRAAAILFVIMIHVSAQGLSYEIGSFHWVASVFWGSVSRGAVPLFLMCSGAVMLDPNRNLTLKKLYTKYILRLLVALFVWALFYKCVGLLTLYRGGGEVHLSNFVQLLKELLGFKHESHLYYMHIIIFLYAWLPVCRVITKHADKNTLLYLLLLWGATGILWPYIRKLPPLNLIAGIPAQYAMNLTYCCMGYLLLGHYMHTYRTKGPWGMLLLYGLGAAALTVTMYVLSIRQGSSAADLLYNANTPFVAMIAIGFFGFFTAQRPAIKGPAPRWVVFLSKSTLCVYLVHVFFLNLMRTHHFYAGSFACIVSIPVVSLAALALSLIVYKIISLIPVLKKYIV